MALIEEFHVIADQYPVEPELNPNIIEGMCVRLNNQGYAVVAAAATAILGLAGDSSETSGGHSPYAADLVIGAHAPGQTANTRSTGNRVSDFFNESLASGKMTVYHSGGKFHTDQYDVADTFTPGGLLYCDAAGKATIVDGGGWELGTAVVAPREFPSGVPGTDTSDGSLSLGQFLTLVLHVSAS